MIVAQAAVDSSPSWLQSAVVAALVSALVSFITIWLNGRRSDRDRQRQVFAEAFGACIDYKEFVFIVRRRSARNPDEERTRITGELSDVQRRLSHQKAVLRVEKRRVGKRYGELVRSTKDIAGPHISRGWDLPPAESDDDVHVRDVDLIDLEDPENLYLQAVEDYLSFAPCWLRTFARWTRSIIARAFLWLWRKTLGRGHVDERSPT